MAGTASSTATISATGNTDPNAGNDFLTKPTTVIAGADLSVLKTGPLGCTSCNAISGDTISFNIAVHNAGPDPATTFEVTDNLPALVDFQYISASGTNWSFSRTGTVLTCTYSGPNVAVGGDAPVITVTGRILLGSGTITNRASIISTDGSTGDPIASNNGPSDVVVTVGPGTTLQANKTMVSAATGMTTYATNETVTLTLSVTNLGPVNATGVTITDVVPANFTILSAPGCTVVGQTITCNVGNLNNGATSSNFVITLQAPATPESGSNTATVSRSTPAAGPDTSATVNYQVVDPFAHLTLTKTKTPNPVADGGNITNTIVVSNSNTSTSTASGPITVTDLLNGHESYISYSGSGWTLVNPLANPLVFQHPGPLARGASLPALVITTQAQAGYLGTITNDACIDGTTHTPPDNVTGDCRSASVIGSNRYGDLSITKSASPAAPTHVLWTDNTFSFTLTVSNNAADVVPTAVVTDSLGMYYTGSAGTTGVIAVIAGQQAGESVTVSGAGLVTATLKDVTQGAPRTITITLTRPFKDGSFTNTATVSSPDSIDTVPGNNTATADVILDPVSDVLVTSIADSPDPVKVGTELSYLTSFRNNGPSTANNIVVRHLIDPSRMSYVAGSASTTSGGSISYVSSFVGAPYAGQSGIELSGINLPTDTSYQLSFKLIPKFPYPDGLPAPYTRTATISTSSNESDTGNNENTNTANVVMDQLDLSVTNNDPGYDPTAFGDPIEYVIVARNNGPSLATGFKLTVTPIPPPQGGAANPYTMTYVSGSLPPGATVENPSAVPLVIYLGADQASSYLASGATATFTLRFSTGPLTNVPNGSITYSTTAVVSSNESDAGHDTLPGNNSVTESTTVLPKTDLVLVSKTVSKPVVDLNEPFNYVITIGNKGPSDVAALSLSDVLPAGFVMTAAATVSRGGGSMVPFSTNTLTWPAIGSGGTLSGNIGPIPADANADNGSANPANQVIITIPMRAAYTTGAYSFAFNTNIPNTASVAAIAGVSIDPTGGNNTQTVNVQVRKNSITGTVFRDASPPAHSNPPVSTGFGINTVTFTLSAVGGVDAYGYAIANIARTSNASGVFLFDNLPPGTWNLVETQPANHSDGLEAAGSAGGTAPPLDLSFASNVNGDGTIAAHNTISGINLPVDTATAATGYLFQEFRNATISGYVYHDLNNNGNRESATETTGINGVAIQLRGTTYRGNTYAPSNQNTLASGAYSFAQVPPGTAFVITETVQPITWLDGADQNGSGVPNVIGGSRTTDVINLGDVQGLASAGTITYTERNFGELKPISIAGYVFIDGDTDAVRDVGETTGVQFVTLTLSGTDDLGNTITPLVTTSGAIGAYSFPATLNIRPGTYTVTETLPTGLTHTGAQAGSNGGTINGTPVGANVGVPGIGNVDISNIVAASQAALTGYNFGESGQILSGKVYVDLNTNGQWDIGEPGIPGVTISLSGITTNGNSVCTEIDPAICTRVTDANGDYAYLNVPVSNPAGYTLAQQSQLTAPLSNYNNGTTTVGSLGGSYAFVANQDTVSGIVVPGGSGINYNFGEIGASLSGRVYLDVNRNNAYDAGTDTNLSGVTIVLSGTTTNASGSVGVCSVLPAGTCTTSTLADGTFSYSGLPAGTLTLTETQPVDYVSATTTAGTGGGTASGTAITNITVSKGVSHPGHLFGEKTGDLSGFVYHDTNNNGTKDIGELGIAGTSLALTGTSAGGQVYNLSATTIADGSYTFTDLKNANGSGYTVTESQPTGYLDGKISAPSGNTTVSNIISAIPYNAAGSNTDYNFGEVLATSISGRVYHDVNNSSSWQSGEELPNVTITLTGNDDRGAAVNLTTTTAANGTYSFTNLRPSSVAGYTLTEIQPTGIGDYPLATGTMVGTIDGTPTGTAALNGITAIVIGSDKTSINNDFRENASSLSGFVYEDTNENGQMDLGEPGIGGVSLALSGIDALGGAVNRTTTTASDGSFSFIVLTSGTYTITETQPAMYFDGRETAGSEGGTVDNGSFTEEPAQNRISAISLGMGIQGTHYLFGEKLKAVLISKTALPASVKAGETITYTLNYVNTSTSPATNVVVRDTLPANTSYVSGGSLSGNVVTWAIGTLAPAATGSVTLVVRADAGLPNGLIIRNSTYDVDADDQTPVGGNEVTTPVINGTAVAEKTVTDENGGNCKPGDLLTYTVILRNIGGLDTNNAVFTDNIPANSTYVPGSISIPAGSTLETETPQIRISGISIPGHGHVILTFRVRVHWPLPPSVTQIVNQGTLQYDMDGDGSNESTTPTDGDTTSPGEQPTVIPIVTGPRLEATKAVQLQIDADSSGSVTPMDTLRYTAKISNSGDQDALAATFLDAIPAGTAYLNGSATASSGSISYNAGLNRIEWSGDISQGSSVTLVFDVGVTSGLPPGTTISNQGTIDGIPTDGDPEEPGPQPTLVITAKPLPPVVTKTATDVNGGLLLPGEILQYTVTLFNPGSLALTGMSFSDAIPAHTSYVAASAIVPAGSSLDTGSPILKVSGINLNAGASATISFQVRVDNPMPAGTTWILNQGSLAYDSDGDELLDSSEPSDADPTAPGPQPTENPVTTAPLLQIHKSANRTTVPPTQTIVYTLNYINLGSAAASNTLVRDAIPTNTTYVSGGTLSGSDVTWNLGTVAPGGSGELTFTVRVNPGLPDGLIIRNNDYTVDSDETDPIPGPEVDVTVTEVLAGSLEGNGTISMGCSALLTWTAENATSGVLMPGNISVDPALGTGEIRVSPLVTTVYTLTLTGPGGTQTYFATVNVNPAPVIQTFEVMPTSIASGELVTFSAAFTGGTGVITPGNHSIAPGGHFTLRPGPSSTTIYTLTVTGSCLESSVSSTAAVTVAPLPTGSFNASQATISSGCSATLAWSALNVNAASIEPLIGALSINNGSGSGQITVYPMVTTTYTLTLVGPGGTRSYATTVQVDPAPNISSFSVNPSSVAPGQAITFSAVFSGGTGLITPGNHPIASGETLVLDPGPGMDTTFILTVQGSCPEVQATAQVAVDVLQPHLHLSKSPSLPSVSHGKTLTYTFVVSNLGDAVARGWILREQLPEYTRFVSASAGGRLLDRTVVWELGDLKPGTTSTVSLTVRIEIPQGVSPEAIVNDSYQVSSEDGHTVVGEPIWTPLESNASLSVLKTASTSTVLPGELLTYRLSYVNRSSIPQTQVVIVEKLPLHTSFVSASHGGSETNGEVRWMMGDLPSFAMGSVQLVVAIHPSLPEGVNQIINAEYRITSKESPPSVGPAVFTPLEGSPLLQVNKHASTPTVAVGGLLTYTLFFENQGDGPATDVSLSDALPSHTEFISATGGGLLNNGWVSWNLNPLEPGFRGSVQFTVRVQDPLPDSVKSIRNSTYSLTSRETPPIAGPEVITPIEGPSFLRIQKTVAQTQALPGQALVYTLTCSNIGTTLATGLRIQDTLPLFTNLIYASHGGILEGRKVTWDLGVLAAGASIVVELMVRVDSPLPSEVNWIHNLDYSVSSIGSEPVTGPPVSLPVPGLPALTLSKSAVPNLVQPGQILVYTLNYSNMGTGTASNVVVIDKLPRHTSFVSASHNGVLTGQNFVEWNLGHLPPGFRGSLSLTVKVDSEIPPDQVEILNDYFSVRSDDAESIFGVPVSTPLKRVPQLSINKSASLSQVQAGQLLNYTLNYRNTGTGEATQVILQDLLPAFTSFDSATHEGRLSGRLVTWTLGSLPPGASGQVGLTIRLDDPLPPQVTTIQNSQYSINSQETGSLPGTPVLTPILGTPRLNISKSTSSSIAYPGQELVYQIKVQNIGTATATQVVIQDDLPVYTSFVSVSDHGVLSGNTVRWTFDSLAVGAQVNVSLVVRVSNTLPTDVFYIFNNDYGVSSDTTPFLPGTPLQTPLKGDPKLSITKTVIPNEASIGQLLSYTLTYRNSGNAPATQVLLTDWIPLHTRFVSASHSGQFLDGAVRGVVSWDLGTLAPGESGQVLLVVRVDDPLDEIVTTIINSSYTLSSNQTNTLLGQPVSVPVKRQPRLLLEKTGTPNPLISGQDLLYTLSFHNPGSQALTGVLLTDGIPENTVFISASDGGLLLARTLYWDLGTLAPGARGSVSFTVRPNWPICHCLKTPEVLNDSFTAMSNETGLIRGPSLRVPVLQKPEWTGTKTDTLLLDCDQDGTVSAGDTLRYIIRLNNTTTTTLQGAWFKDLPGLHSRLLAGTVKTTRGKILRGNMTGDTEVHILWETFSGQESAEITFDVQIDSLLPDGLKEIRNQGLLGADNYPTILTDDPDTPTWMDPTRTALGRSSQLKLSKTWFMVEDLNLDGFPGPGDQVGYHLDVQNTGAAVAEEALVKDLPHSLALLIPGTISMSQGQVIRGQNPGDTWVEVLLGRLAPGEHGEVTYHARIVENLPPCTEQIPNQAMLDARDLPTVFSDDPCTKIPEDPTQITIAQPRLVFTKGAAMFSDPDRVPGPGDSIEYVFVVYNDGSAPATQIYLEDELSPLFILDKESVKTSQGIIVERGPKLRVDLGNLPVGHRAFVSMNVRILDPLPESTYWISNQARLECLELGEQYSDDPVTLALEDPTRIYLGQRSVLRLSLRDQLGSNARMDGIPQPGDTMVYRAQIVNEGFGNSGPSLFSDQVDPWTILDGKSLRVDHGQILISEGAKGFKLEWPLIPAGAERILSFRARIQDALPQELLWLSNQAELLLSDGKRLISDDPDTLRVEDPTVRLLGAAQPEIYGSMRAILLSDHNGNGHADPGDILQYHIRIHQQGLRPSLEVGFRDMPDPHTILIPGSVQSSRGRILRGNNQDDSDVDVFLGRLPIGADVDLRFQVQIKPSLPTSVVSVSNQGFIRLACHPEIPTDDPDTPTPKDPTIVLIRR